MEQLTPDDTIQHYNAVMIEDIRSIVDTAVEGLSSRMDSLEGKISSLDTKFDSFRKDVEIQFEILGAEVRRNSQGIKELRAIMHRIIDNVDSQEERIANLETA